jgi:hypothetical protein
MRKHSTIAKLYENYINENKGLSRETSEGVSVPRATIEPTTRLSPLAWRTRNDPNRHTGVSSAACNCGLVHDDELLSPKQKREKLVELFGGRCMNPRCRWQNKDGTFGCTDKRAFQIDHVYDDGFMEKNPRTGLRRPPNWTKILAEVEAGSDRYQLLCANCNWIKRSTSGVWAIDFGLHQADLTRQETKQTKQKERAKNEQYWR